MARNAADGEVQVDGDVAGLQSSAEFDEDAFGALIEALPERVFGVPGSQTTDFEALTLARAPHQAFVKLREDHGALLEVRDGHVCGEVFPQTVGFPPDASIFLILDYETAVEMVAQPAEILSMEKAIPSHAATWGRVLGFVEGDDHRRFRRALDKAVFGRKVMEERADELLKPAADYLVRRLAAKIARGDVGDAKRDLALPMVYKPVSRLIGVPEEGFAHFMPLCEAALLAPWDAVAARCAMEDLGTFFEGELEHRKTCPADDIISKLLQSMGDKASMSEAEIVAHARFLLPAGLDTTRFTTTNMLAALMLHPEQYQDLVCDPDLIPQAVEECQRWLPAATAGGMRCVLQDTTLAGTRIPAGSYVSTIFPAINRDPKRWDEPERFDIHRDPNPEHFGFSVGRHYCIGQNLARQVMRHLLHALVTQLPDLRLAIPASEVKIQGMPLSNPVRLPLTA